MAETSALLNLPKTKTINISFENISYSVPKPGLRSGMKQILKSLTGEFRSGELTAIMGPSGSGKSSLLNILTGFSTKGMQGCIYRNGVSYTEKAGNFKRDSCYIMQDDLLSPLLTVNEYMMTAAQLKLGICNSEKSQNLLIEDILDNLGLRAVGDVACAKLSGGQRKRLSIALELLDNPAVMFLDEPTTGLDSSSTTQCVKLLKALARNGRSIICTIHTPSALVYEMFDHVYILSEGLNIYQGSSKNTVAYLTHTGLPCPQYHSVADYISELAAGDHGNHSEKLSIMAADSRWRGPPIISKHDQLTRKNIVKPSPPSEFTKVWILINKNLILLHREWTVTYLKILIHCLLGILVGMTMVNCGQDGAKTISNIGFLFATIIYLSYTALMPAILIIPRELLIIKKERFNNWYTLRSYYIAFLTTSTPIQLLYTFVFVSVSYYTTSQMWDLQRFGMYLTMCMLTSLISESIGLSLGTMKNIVQALYLGAFVIAYLLVYSGCLAPFPHMSATLYAFAYISYGKYAFDGLIISQYGNKRPNLVCPMDVEFCPLRSPTRVMTETGVEDGFFWHDVSVLITMFIFLRIVAFVTLHRKVSCN